MREFNRIAKQNAELEENRGTCYGEFGYRRTKENPMHYTGLQNKDCVCPTNNTCAWSHDGVCDDVKMNDNGVCAEGTDCEDCGTCNWYMCVLKDEVPKPTNIGSLVCCNDECEHMCYWKKTCWSIARDKYHGEITNGSTALVAIPTRGPTPAPCSPAPQRRSNTDAKSMLSFFPNHFSVFDM